LACRAPLVDVYRDGVSTGGRYTRAYVDVRVWGWGLGSTVLSVRVRRELKEEAERLGVNVREVVERALEEAVRRRRVELIAEALEEMRRQFARGVTREDWVEAIREGRRRAPAAAT
jgi:post-segregation antitoxin (ccd killing protein)